MTLTVVHEDTTIKTQSAPAWFLHRQRNAALNRQRDPFDRDAWLQAISRSTLSPQVKETAQHIADNTDWYGTTNVSRYDLAAAAGVTRVATITARTQQLRDGGYITTEQRFNKTSTYQLAFPYDA